MREKRKQMSLEDDRMTRGGEERMRKVFASSRWSSSVRKGVLSERSCMGLAEGGRDGEVEGWIDQRWRRRLISMCV